MSRDPALKAAQPLPHHRQPASGQHHHGLAEARNRVEVSRLKAEYVSQEAQYLLFEVIDQRTMCPGNDFQRSRKGKEKLTLQPLLPPGDLLHQQVCLLGLDPTAAAAPQTKVATPKVQAESPWQPWSGLSCPTACSSSLSSCGGSCQGQP